MRRRALVTGGAGFIGSHVADLLLEHDYEVDVLDNLVSGKPDNVPAGATFHDADITRGDAARLVRDGGFDVICHLAAQIDVRKSVADPTFDAAVNVLGTVNLLEAARGAKRRARFIFSSTGGAIYGDYAPPPHPEDRSKEPDAPYGIGKLAGEHYLSFYARVHGLDTVALRYANVYGPRQDPHGEAGVVAIFCGRALAGRPATVFGDGRQTRDYVYVGDVARANLLAADARLPSPSRLDSRAFNIGTGVATSVLQLVDVLAQASGRPLPVEFAPARPGEQMASVVTNDKARAGLGWRPEVGLEDGLRRTFDWFAERHARAAR